jgi:hypothetical protein
MYMSWANTLFSVYCILLHSWVHFASSTDTCSCISSPAAVINDGRPPMIIESDTPVFCLDIDGAVQTTPNITCTGCSQPVLLACALAVGYAWHPQCVKCQICGDVSVVHACDFVREWIGCISLVYQLNGFEYSALLRVPICNAR